MVSCALWEFEEAHGWVILNYALAPLVILNHASSNSPYAQLTIPYCPILTLLVNNAR